MKVQGMTANPTSGYTYRGVGIAKCPVFRAWKVTATTPHLVDGSPVVGKVYATTLADIARKIDDYLDNRGYVATPQGLRSSES